MSTWSLFKSRASSRVVRTMSTSFSPESPRMVGRSLSDFLLTQGITEMTLSFSGGMPIFSAK